MVIKHLVFICTAAVRLWTYKRISFLKSSTQLELCLHLLRFGIRKTRNTKNCVFFCSTTLRKSSKKNESNYRRINAVKIRPRIACRAQLLSPIHSWDFALNDQSNAHGYAPFVVACALDCMSKSIWACVLIRLNPILFMPSKFINGGGRPKQDRSEAFSYVRKCLALFFCFFSFLRNSDMFFISLSLSLLSSRFLVFVR